MISLNRTKTHKNLLITSIQFILVSLLLSCNQIGNNQSSIKTDTVPISLTDTNLNTENSTDIKNIQEDSSYSFIKMLDSLGYINILKVDSSIKIDLKYSKENNFFEKDLYGNFNVCYLEQQTAEKLKVAQQKLKKIDQTLSLIVFDAIRPRNIQRIMWKSSKLEHEDKIKFLANPDLISLHNFGTAVDVGIIMQDGTLLDMGTEFDFPGELAYPSLEDYFAEKNILGINIIQNRRLLRRIMVESGFLPNKYEWWHFNSCSRNEALQKFTVIESFTRYSRQTGSNTLKQNSIIFKIQIAASKTKKNYNESYLNRKTEMYIHDNMFKYTVGNFNNLKETYEFRDQLRKCCFEQCFVVCFNGKTRINILEAIELTE